MVRRDEQRAAYVLADNQLALVAGWDTDVLKAELDALGEAGFDLASIGKYSWIPFAVLAIGNIAGGWIPTALMRRWVGSRSCSSGMATRDR